MDDSVTRLDKNEDLALEMRDLTELHWARNFLRSKGDFQRRQHRSSRLRSRKKESRLLHAQVLDELLDSKDVAYLNRSSRLYMAVRSGNRGLVGALEGNQSGVELFSVWTRPNLSSKMVRARSSIIKRLGHGWQSRTQSAQRATILTSYICPVYLKYNYISLLYHTACCIKREKRRGPMTLPCGTPLVVGRKLDIVALIFTHCERLVRKN